MVRVLGVLLGAVLVVGCLYAYDFSLTGQLYQLGMPRFSGERVAGKTIENFATGTLTREVEAAERAFSIDKDVIKRDKAVAEAHAKYNHSMEIREGLEKPSRTAAAPSTLTASPKKTSTSLVDFNFEIVDENQFAVDVDARQPWTELYTPSAGEKLQITATGEICSGTIVGCDGPAGRGKRCQDPDFVFPSAPCRALIGKIGNRMFVIGPDWSYQVTAREAGQPLEVMPNTRKSRIADYDGGFHLKLQTNS